MRQHAIPQNILDIEFKLFSKFTIKEFIYIAVGIALGSIFLFLFSGGTLPGIIAIPLFLLFSGIGLFLGLANINDQKADIYIMNYFKAITNPTMRVWKNKQFDDKFEEIKPIIRPDEGAGLTGITESNNLNSKIVEDSNQFESSLSQDEENRLARINQIHNAPVQSMPVNQTITSPILIQTQSIQPEAVQSQPVPPKQIKLTIGAHNSEKLKAVIINIQNIANNLNIQLVQKNGTPIAQAITTFKDKDFNIIQTIASDQNGNVITNKIYPNGSYFVNIQHGQYIFPTLEFILEGKVICPIKLIPLN